MGARHINDMSARHALKVPMLFSFRIMESTRDSWGSACHNPTPYREVQEEGRRCSIPNDGTRCLRRSCHWYSYFWPWTSVLLPLRPLWVSLSTGMIGSCHLYSYIWPGTRLAYGRGFPRLMLPGN